MGYGIATFRFGTVLLATMAVLAGSAAGQSSVSFTDFSDLSDFSLNGDTGSINTGGQGAIGPGGDRVLRLTNGLQQAGGAFLTDPFSLASDASFSSFFRFQITDPVGSSDSDGQGADGIVFVVQTDAAEMGGTGGGIGYEGISPSAGVEFDTWNNGVKDDWNGNHIGIDLNGVDANSAQADVSPRFNNGNVWHSWVDYDGTTNTLEARVSTNNARPTNPTVSRNVDLAEVLGQTSAFIGFTSGTGSAGGDHDILSWQFEGQFEPLDTELVTTPGDGQTLSFLARVDSQATETIAVSNGGPTGTPDLTGSAGSPSAPLFSGPDAGPSFALEPGAASTFTYTYSPDARTAGTPDIDAVDIFSNEDGTHTVTLEGAAVGPVADFSLAHGGTLDFEQIPASDMKTLPIDVFNVTGDGDLDELTDLTLNGFDIGGTDADKFSLVGFNPGEVAAVGQPLRIEVKFNPNGMLGTFDDATLTLFTDQGAAKGGDGQDFTFALSGAAIPEPGSLALLGLGGMVLLTRRR